MQPADAHLEDGYEGEVGDDAAMDYDETQDMPDEEYELGKIVQNGSSSTFMLTPSSANSRRRRRRWREGCRSARDR